MRLGRDVLSALAGAAVVTGACAIGCAGAPDAAPPTAITREPAATLVPIAAAAVPPPSEPVLTASLAPIAPPAPEAAPDMHDEALSRRKRALRQLGSIGTQHYTFTTITVSGCGRG